MKAVDIIMTFKMQGVNCPRHIARRICNYIMCCAGNSLSSQAFTLGIPPGQLLSSLQPALERLTLHHHALEAALGSPHQHPARCPTAGLSANPEDMQLALAVEMAQPIPAWPPGFLGKVKQRMTVPQIDHVRTIVAISATLSALVSMNTLQSTVAICFSYMTAQSQ